MTDDDLPIVDAHHHLWDLEGEIRYPWLISGEHGWLGDYSRIRRAYLPPSFAETPHCITWSQPSMWRRSVTGRSNLRRPSG